MSYVQCKGLGQDVVVVVCMYVWDKISKSKRI